MLFRRIRSPRKHGEEKRHQTNKSGQSSQDLAKETCGRCLRRSRTRQPAQTWRASHLSILVRYAFAAERSSAVWAPCGRFPQRMKQAARMAQTHGGGFVEGGGRFLRSHSSVSRPRRIQSRLPRTSFELGVLPVRQWLPAQPAARWHRECRELRHQSWPGPSLRRGFASPAAGQRSPPSCGSVTWPSAPALVPPPPTREPG